MHGPGTKKTNGLASPSRKGGRISSPGWRAHPGSPSSPEGTLSRLSWQGRDELASSRLASSELGIESQLEAGIDAGRSSLDWAAANRGPHRPRDSVQSLNSHDSGSLLDRAKSPDEMAPSRSPIRKQQQQQQQERQEGLDSIDLPTSDVPTRQAASSHSHRQADDHHRQRRNHGSEEASDQMSQPVEEFVENVATTEGETCSVSEPSLAPLALEDNKPEALQEKGFSAEAQPQTQPPGHSSSGGSSNGALAPHSRQQSQQSRHRAGPAVEAGVGTEIDLDSRKLDGQHAILAASGDQTQESRLPSGSGSQSWDDDSGGGFTDLFRSCT